jgi:glutamine synthetase
MDVMKKVADQHGLVCLLHEKPFAGVNGSGKHNNWSISTNTGKNLLDPGHTPHQNAQFLLFLSAIIKAVDEYQDLLRVSIASAGNDHRLGANEAPPAIVSIFLGDELTAIMDAIDTGSLYSHREKTSMQIGVDVLPSFPKDTTDRNRTSPFAFTGNKFEFRMLGSAQSISGPNIILNTIVAEELRKFADVLESAEDFTAAMNDLVKSTIRDHKRIIFNGNGYEDAWVVEAKKRGLLNLRSTPEALATFIAEKNLDLFTRHRIFSTEETHARYEITMETYHKTLSIEALTMADMVKKDILPAVYTYISDLSHTAISARKLLPSLGCTSQVAMIEKLSALADSVYTKTATLEAALESAKTCGDATDCAFYYRETVFPAMQDLRESADEIEMLVGEKYWPYPTYGELLFSV